ncbi:hypothetical protein PUMCH_003757 [Australozyma saopauloensis]|uniref:Uncharacterized protein n=1 Tax=Australozyma saopauloensis TaxID=291208 RepID=A0AAX4HDK6_9ASCO|nr:hypothetical protein PUMCH_003757 [[Candida] saopauloensis]
MPLDALRWKARILASRDPRPTSGSFVTTYQIIRNFEAALISMERDPTIAYMLFKVIHEAFQKCPNTRTRESHRMEPMRRYKGYGEDVLDTLTSNPDLSFKLALRFLSVMRIQPSTERTIGIDSLYPGEVEVKALIQLMKQDPLEGPRLMSRIRRWVYAEMSEAFVYLFKVPFGSYKPSDSEQCLSKSLPCDPLSPREGLLTDLQRRLLREIVMHLVYEIVNQERVCSLHELNPLVDALLRSSGDLFVAIMSSRDILDPVEPSSHAENTDLNIRQELRTGPRYERELGILMWHLEHQSANSAFEDAKILLTEFRTAVGQAFVKGFAKTLCHPLKTIYHDMLVSANTLLHGMRHLKLLFSSPHCYQGAPAFIKALLTPTGYFVFDSIIHASEFPAIRTLVKEILVFEKVNAKTLFSVAVAMKEHWNLEIDLKSLSDLHGVLHSFTCISFVLASYQESFSPRLLANTLKEFFGSQQIPSSWISKGTENWYREKNVQ